MSPKQSQPLKRPLPKWTKAFLRALSNGNSMTRASEIARVHRTSVFKLRQRREDFEKLYQDACEQSADRLEDRARERADKGNDLMTIFLLKGLRPEKFRENFTVSGNPKQPIVHQHEHEHRHKMSVDQCAQIMDVLYKAGAIRLPDTIDHLPLPPPRANGEYPPN
jgi:hypothetical protein